jgi:signal transduction histidine kinase
MMKKKRKYIPLPKYNPVVHGEKLEKLQKEVTRVQNVLKMVIASYDRHVEHLANFANHDIKNTIQSMDSILFTNNYNEIDEEVWKSLKTCLHNIRSTFDNFSQLVPYSQTKSFTIDRLFIALTLLTKNDLHENEISFFLDYPKNSGIELNLPFQSILQLLHNLVINTINAFKVQRKNEQVLKIEAEIADEFCNIVISDNAFKIGDEIKDKIFEYGFSTTNGSGIGLFHAKYVCSEINGTISLNLDVNEEFTKSFIIKFPIKFP